MWLEETTARATCRLWSTTTMLPINGVSFPPTWATDAATQGCQLLTSHYDKRFWAAGLLSPAEGWSVTDRRWYKTESRCRQVLHLKAWLPHKHTHTKPWPLPVSRKCHLALLLTERLWGGPVSCVLKPGQSTYGLCRWRLCQESLPDNARYDVRTVSPG